MKQVRHRLGYAVPSVAAVPTFVFVVGRGAFLRREDGWAADRSHRGVCYAFLQHHGDRGQVKAGWRLVGSRMPIFTRASQTLSTSYRSHLKSEAGGWSDFA